MKTSILVAALTVVIGSIAGAQDTEKDDLAKMQGEWRIKRDMLSKEDAINRLTITDHQYKYRVGNSRQEGSVKLDPTKTPKQMDINYTAGSKRGKTALAIYKIEDDILTLCIANIDKPRPKEFKEAEGQELQTWTKRK
jgi:uncharacterized protein (TIGR03067 family)